MPVIAERLVEVTDEAVKLVMFVEPRLVRPSTAKFVVVALLNVVAFEMFKLVPVAETKEVRFKTVRPLMFKLVEVWLVTVELTPERLVNTRPVVKMLVVVTFVRSALTADKLVEVSEVMMPFVEVRLVKTPVEGVV